LDKIRVKDFRASTLRWGFFISGYQLKNKDPEALTIFKLTIDNLGNSK
jgi:hypothetical protein